MGRVKKNGNRVGSEKDPLSHLKRLQMGIFGFHRKRLEPRVLALITKTALNGERLLEKGRSCWKEGAQSNH